MLSFKDYKTNKNNWDIIRSNCLKRTAVCSIFNYNQFAKGDKIKYIVYILKDKVYRCNYLGHDEYS